MIVFTSTIIDNIPQELDAEKTKKERSTGKH
jgi:hypothetical protein